MGIDAADATGDGRMDFYICHMDNQPNRLYQNNGDATFKDITLSSGLGFTSIRNTSYAARFVDWDNDGNRDLIVVNGSMLDNIRLYHPGSTYANRRSSIGILEKVNLSTQPILRTPHFYRRA